MSVFAFQFHKGTIRTKQRSARLSEVRNFNSIKVQLEPILYALDNFQIVFQFHKGTIRTHHRTPEILSLYDFNSIKVQLEQSDFTNIAFSPSDFNSIKVQLERKVRFR